MGTLILAMMATTFMACNTVLLLTMTACGPVKREMQYVKDAKAAVGDAEWLNFDVAQMGDTIGGVTTPYMFSVLSHLDDKDPYYVVVENEIMRYTMIKGREALVVDGMSRELCRFVGGKDDETGWFEQISFEKASQLEYLSFYTVVFPKQVRNMKLIPMIERIADTTLSGVAYRKYEAKHSQKRVWNEEANEFDIPLQYASQIWLNLSTNQLDSVFVRGVSDFHSGQKEYYRVSSVNHEDRSKFVDSLFNFDNLAYAGYTRHTESFPPYSRVGSSNETLDESVLLFPFVRLQNDTLTLDETEGWLLLDVWQFGCQPCYQGFERLQCERDSLGHGVLEGEGIRIVAANAKSDNMELIGKVAEKYNAQDFLYAGKGLTSVLSLVNHGFPSYYLISPEKEIVWRSNSLGDYSSLHEAMFGFENVFPAN